MQRICNYDTNGADDDIRTTAANNNCVFARSGNVRPGAQHCNRGGAVCSYGCNRNVGKFRFYGGNNLLANAAALRVDNEYLHLFSPCP